MSFEAERSRIEKHFRDNWSTTEFSSLVVQYENVRITQPSATYIIHQIPESGGRQAELGGKNDPVFHRYNGLVQVDILVPVGQGSAQARKIGDTISTIYRRQQLIDTAGGIITFRTPSIRALGMVGERYRFVVTCPYQKDIRH